MKLEKTHQQSEQTTKGSFKRIEIILIIIHMIKLITLQEE